MKLTQNEELLAKSKVIILYILNKIGKALTNDSLYKLVLASQDMNYFYFQQFMLDLQEANYVMQYVLEEETVYEITASGKDVLSLVEDIIPGILKLKMEGTLKEQWEEIQEENSVTSEYMPISQTEFLVKCKIVENNKTIFAVETYAGSRKKAKQVSDNWNQNAQILYPKLLELLDQEHSETKDS